MNLIGNSSKFESHLHVITRNLNAIQRVHNMNRRQAIRLLGLTVGTLVSPQLSFSHGKKKHIITLSFDDGFKKSSILTAAIFEKYQLAACINVIATGHLPDFKQ